MEARLTTAAGDYVATVWIPKFDPPPGVVIWGERVFTRYEAREYREAFAYYCPPASTAAGPSAPIAPTSTTAAPRPPSWKKFDDEAT